MNPLIALILPGVLVAAQYPAPEVVGLRWPTEVVYRPASSESMAFGPSAAFTDGTDVWLYNVPSHTFFRIGPDGDVLDRVPGYGIVHSFIVRDDGSIAWVDLARGHVGAVDRYGRTLLDVSLPAGLRHVRRIVSTSNGDLMLHTAYQETFRVPGSHETGWGLREWFLARREGLVLPSEPRLSVVVETRAGRVVVRTLEAPTTPCSGPAQVNEFLLDCMAVEVIDGSSDGLWLRVTDGYPGSARDLFVLVGQDGQVHLSIDLPGDGTLSWADRLWVLDDRSAVFLRATDRGIEIVTMGGGES